MVPSSTCSPKCFAMAFHSSIRSHTNTLICDLQISFIHPFFFIFGETFQEFGTVCSCYRVRGQWEVTEVSICACHRPRTSCWWDTCSTYYLHHLRLLKSAMPCKWISAGSILSLIFWISTCLGASSILWSTWMKRRFEQMQNITENVTPRCPAVVPCSLFYKRPAALLISLAVSHDHRR